MNDLRNRLAALSPEQRARLLERVRQERPTSAEASTADRATMDKTAGKPDVALAPIAAADRSQPLPLSFAQRRIWFLERLEGRSAAYNMPAAFRLQGDLDTAAVAAALDEIARRHEVLRTRLIDQDGEPAQVIDPPGGASLCRTLSLAAVPPAERDERLRGVLAAEAAHVFDLANEHPIRALLVDLGPDDHVLAVTLHHVASDGWSTGVLVREFAALYGSMKSGEQPSLAELPVQYADFAQWQRGQVESDAATRPHLDYWRAQLGDAPGVINLPVDASLPRHSASRQDEGLPRQSASRQDEGLPRQSASRQDEGLPRQSASPEGASATAGRQAEGLAVYFRIDAGTAEAVNALARRTDASAYMVLLAAFMALLHRWSGDHDLTVGSPIANRPRKDLEGLIGFFVNTLALRVNVGGDPDFLALLARVRATALEGYAHADLPFELVVEKLNPERRLDRAPFFQVMFAMQSGALQDVALDGLRIEAVPLATGAARFDLTLSIQETGEGFAGCLEFSTALFRTDTAQRFAEHFRNMVEAAVRQPSTALSQLDYLGYGERHRLLVEWNRTDMPVRPRCLHQLVEDQAARTPNAVALRWNGTSWTYAQLMAQVDRAALLLQQKGVGVETLVGVCMSRTPEMIVALLGVLKAGGAYVALDPAYPAARTEYVIADSGATIVLRDGAFDTMSPDKPEGLPPLAPSPDKSEGLSPQISPFVPPAITPSNLAYVLYTSGSTGQPKGVAIEHRSPAALIAWAQTVWSPAELSGVLAGTSICFDLSVFEIFLPLSVGGTVVLANNVLELPQLADRGHVTLINTVPSAIDALLLQRAIPPSVRNVNLAGEPLTTELADRIYDVGTVAKVYDLYGPSEDTTYSTFILRRRGDPPSIGRPIANTRLYILDQALQPVPVGVPGEIFLAGQGLARGYLGRPDLTSERFIPSPFTGVDRLYRTGDRARFRDDGNVEFLGRFDHQVKLRGFRIELGEIESVARDFPEVGQCVVTVEDNRAGHPRLVAYASHPRAQAVADQLHAHLRSRLPEYMVPPVLVVLDKLPLTPNGKIDRKALPAPDQRRATDDDGRPSAEEARLASLWQSLMAVERVRPNDDFFALGGHSLLAAKLGARIRDAYQVELPLRAIFEHSTLRQQAAAIAALQAAAPGGLQAGVETRVHELEVIPVVARLPRMPLSFAQERLWFLDQLEPGNAAYNMAGAIRLRGAIDVPALRAAFDQIVERQESLRTVFPTSEGRGYAAPAAQRPELREIASAGVAAFLADEQARPFSLADGPLIRASLIRVSPDEAVLAVTMHHIISDGWSVEVFLDELCRLYAAQIDGTTAALAPLAVQYLDFAAWQRARFASGLLAPQLAYWRETLAGAPALLALPTDRPRPDAQSYQGAAHTLTIDSSLTALVAQRARESGVTPFMTQLAAFGALLNRWSGQDDMVIGFPAAGRSRSELEPLIGMFVNTVPIRLQIPAGSSFASLLAHVKARTVDALTHQDVPFEKLVDELGVERSLAWPPLFQVMFISQQSATAPALPAGLRAEPIPNAETGTAKFDLTLAVAEGKSGLTVSVEYDRALFDAATIERFASDYVEVLRTGLEAPDAPLALNAGRDGSRLSAVAPGAKAEDPLAVTGESRQAVAATAPATPIEQALAGIWRQVLHLDEVGVTDNFFEIGGDSIVSIQVIAQLRERGWRIDPRQIFRHQTIRALAAVAEPVVATAGVEEPAGPLALSPMQRLFFDLQPPSPNHFNQSLLLELAPDVDAAALQRALTEVQRVHPSLRSRFRPRGGDWVEQIHPEPDVAVEHHVLPDASRLEAICQAAQRSLDIQAGPVFRAVLAECRAAGSRLLLVAHHLVVDAVSWRIILTDIETAYAQARRGERPLLPAEPCGPAAFRHLAASWSSSADAESQAGYWTEVASAAGHLFGSEGPPAAAQPRIVTRTMSEDDSRPLLGAAHRAYSTTTADLLLAAFARALGAVAGREAFLVDVEGHGRDALPGADLSRTVGWFTTLYPVRVTGVGTSDAASLIRAVKESSRSVPSSGIGFGFRPRTGHAAPLADVSFNFLGQTAGSLGDGLVRSVAPESAGDPVAADLPRRYHLELNASVIDGRLVTQYSFDAAVVPQQRVDEVADRTAAALRELTSHCLGIEGARYTPSDFAAVPVDQQELDALLGDLDLSGLSEA